MFRGGSSLSREVDAPFGGYYRVARFVIYLPHILIDMLDSFLCTTGSLMLPLWRVLANQASNTLTQAPILIFEGILRVYAYKLHCFMNWNANTENRLLTEGYNLLVGYLITDPSDHVVVNYVNHRLRTARCSGR